MDRIYLVRVPTAHEKGGEVKQFLEMVAADVVALAIVGLVAVITLRVLARKRVGQEGTVRFIPVARSVRK